MDLWLSRIGQGIGTFLSHGWWCIGVAFVLLVFAMYTMKDSQSSAGMWGFILVAVVLIMIGLGNITGMGFSMSF